MSDRNQNVVYIAPLLCHEIEDKYDIDWYSIAAQNKIRGIIQSIYTTDRDVIVISPVVEISKKLSYSGRFRTQDIETGASVVVPPSMNLFGMMYINRLITSFLTILVALQLHLEDESKSTIFYNLRLTTAFPAFTVKFLLNSSIVLEYEDGLFTTSSPSGILARIFKRTIGTQIDGAICVNSRLAEVLDNDNLTIVRGFPSVGYPNELPDAIFTQSESVVMFAGTFDKTRGIDNFLSIIPRVENDKVRFWISGTGRDQELERIQKEVKRLDDDRVEFFGTLSWEQYRRRIVSADVFVNFQDPQANISKYTFPSKLLDFLSAGGLIVSTDMSDLSDIFSEEIIITEDTEIEMAEAVMSAVEITRDGGYSKERQKDWIRRNCTHDITGDRIDQILTTAIG